jgi:hypothetical protein
MHYFSEYDPCLDLDFFSVALAILTLGLSLLFSSGYFAIHYIIPLALFVPPETLDRILR